MRELGSALETWQQQKDTSASFSMLWSDIGRSFYAAHGWTAMSSTHLSIPASSRQLSIQSQECSHIQDLSSQDLQNRICPKAIAVLEDQLRRRSKKRSSVPHIAIRPDYDHMQWHHAREEFEARQIDKDPKTKGAEDPATGCALIWSRVWGETPEKNKLHILYTLIPPDADCDVIRSITALLLRAQDEVKTWDMHGGLELWSPATDVVKAAQFLAGKEQVQITVRDKDSICSLRWVGGAGEEVEWVANERYAWC